MREILFRGKETETRKWYYGGFFPHKHTTYCFKEDYDAHPENDAPCIVFDEMTDWGLPNRAKLATVIPETVGQYIGLKDKNGQKIFEGDIISIHGSKKQGLPAPVYYMDGFYNPEFVIRRNGYTPMCLTNVEEWGEVVGNIWDNPELLKED